MDRGINGVKTFSSDRSHYDPPLIFPTGDLTSETTLDRSGSYCMGLTKGSKSYLFSE